MKRHLMVIAMLVLVGTQMPGAGAATLDEPGKLPPGRTDQKDKSQEDDCDCCQKCEAAKKPHISHEEEGADDKSGCEQCCDRCGRPLPSSEDTPPDIIEKPQR